MVFVGVVVVGLAVARALDQGSAVAEVGARAPDFTVELIGGGSFDLSQHIEEDGRPLVLNLWASWCIPCREEMPTLDDFAAGNPELTVLGVSVEDARADSEDVRRRGRGSYPLGLGDEAFRAAYPSFGLPATYYIDGEGTVVRMINGLLDEETLDLLVG